MSKRQKQKFNKQAKKTLNQNGDQNQLQTNKQKSGQNNVGSSSTEKPKTRKEKKAEKVQKLTGLFNSFRILIFISGGYLSLGNLFFLFPPLVRVNKEKIWVNFS